jgi:hypothetical protein
MKKAKKLIIVLVVMVALVVLSVAFFKYQGGKVVKSDTGTALELNIDKDYILDNVVINKVTFNENGTSTEYSYNNLGITYSIPDDTMDELLSSPELDLNNVDVDYDFTYLSGILDKMNTSRLDSTPASIMKEDDGFIIIDAEAGNSIDSEKLASYIEDNQDNKELEINLEDFYKELDDSQPTSEELQEVVTKFNDGTITYTNGHSLNLVDFTKYFETDGSDIQLTTDEATREEFKADLKETLTSVLNNYEVIDNGFYTTDGRVVQINDDESTWGKTIEAELDIDKEVDYIANLFKDNDSIWNFTNIENRTPIYTQTKNGIGDTYIEVDIVAQHVWHYVDGELHCDADCVTGNLADGHDTPSGFYTIVEMVPGKYLWPKGVTEGIWVDRWMRTTWTGYGLHDAQWREEGEFGGDIYKENGSHGCINMPTEYAYQLYDDAYLGLPVVIYN